MHDEKTERFFEFWVAASPEKLSGVFSLSEYLSALALLLVILAVSDFKYQLRLSLLSPVVRRVSFWVSTLCAGGLLLIEFWYRNELRVPFFLYEANNLKLLIGFVFLGFILYLSHVAFLGPRRFDESTASQYLKIAYQLVASGDEQKLRTYLEEIASSVDQVFEHAAQLDPKDDGENLRTRKDVVYATAHDLILLFADPRLCKIVASSSPGFAARSLIAYKEKALGKVPFSAFHRNLATAFLADRNSSIYHEESGFDSGLVGYVKESSTAIFGSYEVVEKSALMGRSPFDIDYRILREFDGEQASTFTRCALLFFDDYLKLNKGATHSYALARLKGQFKLLASDAYKLNDPNDYGVRSSEHQKLAATVEFVLKAMELLDKHKTKALPLRFADFNSDAYEHIADIAFDVIAAASSVTTEDFASWDVQHNTVWSPIVSGFKESNARKIIRRRIFRKIYDEIDDGQGHANFRSARLIGTILYVVGLRPIDRYKDHNRHLFAIQKVTTNWIKANFINLRKEYPAVADAMLVGTITFEEDSKNLVQTFRGSFGKPGAQVRMTLN
jgi:hypothetical protein